MTHTGVIPTRLKPSKFLLLPGAAVSKRRRYPKSSLLFGHLGLVLACDSFQVFDEAALLLQSHIHLLQLDADIHELPLRIAHTIVLHPEQVIRLLDLHLSLHSLHRLELFGRAEFLELIAQHYVGLTSRALLLVSLRFFHELFLIDAIDVVFDALVAWKRRRKVLQQLPAWRELLLILISFILKVEIIIEPEVWTFVFQLVGVSILSIERAPVVFFEKGE